MNATSGTTLLPLTVSSLLRQHITITQTTPCYFFGIAAVTRILKKADVKTFDARLSNGKRYLSSANAGFGKCCSPIRRHAHLPSATLHETPQAHSYDATYAKSALEQRLGISTASYCWTVQPYLPSYKARLETKASLSK